MNMTRQVEARLVEHFKKYRFVLILTGPRQVGKTTLLKRLFPEAKYFLCDEGPVRSMLETYDSQVYGQFLKDTTYVIFDEIHLIENPGRAAKIIYDLMPDKRVILTGSSALNIKNKTSESLAGRKMGYKLYPLTISEVLFQSGAEKEINLNVMDNILNDKESTVKLFDHKNITERLLLYGGYPYLLNSPENKNYLGNLAETVIFKDIIELGLLEGKTTAKTLLKLLAYQIGNLISYSELAAQLNVDMRTVQRYIDIFEECFIVFRVYPFSGNKRKEITRNPKIYFYDNGIRNALINNFEEIDKRGDKGALFENFIVSEIVKTNDYGNFGFEVNFWRTKDGSEVDLVLSKHNEEVHACEIKYSGGSVSKAFTNRYPEAKTRVITAENYY